MEWVCTVDKRHTIYILHVCIVQYIQSSLVKWITTGGVSLSFYSLLLHDLLSWHLLVHWIPCLTHVHLFVHDRRHVHFKKPWPLPPEAALAASRTVVSWTGTWSSVKCLSWQGSTWFREYRLLRRPWVVPSRYMSSSTWNDDSLFIKGMHLC